MKVIQKSLLHYQKGQSNKVYNIYLVELEEGGYLVNFEYGRTGGNLKSGTKTPQPVELAKAQKLYDSLALSKIKKDYHLLEGYDSKNKREKKERNTLDSERYKAQLLDKIERAGVIKERKFAPIDNYPISRLIYRLGELKISEAKEKIITLYEQSQEEERAFYYAVAWSLGRFQDPSLRPWLESLRSHLDASASYVVEEALLKFHEPKELEALHQLSLPAPHQLSTPQSIFDTIDQSNRDIAQIYENYQMMDDYYYRREKAQLKTKIITKLSLIDEIYLKIYLLALDNASAREVLLQLLPQLPIYKENFSLFRRLYKMAEFRDDYEVIAKLITHLESKKMACFQSYNYHNNSSVRSVGCSRLYFKKRLLRKLKDLARHDPWGYVTLSKEILLSLNGYEEAFKAFKREYYQYNYSTYSYTTIRKLFDPFAIHISLMYILFANGQRYMITPSKKYWEIANKSIKDEHNTHAHPALWNQYPYLSLEILALSKVEIVQKFAYELLQSQPLQIQDQIIQEASIEMLLPLLSLHYQEGRKLFFERLKTRYLLTKEKAILRAFLSSSDTKIEAFGLQVIAQHPHYLADAPFVVSFILSLSMQGVELLLPHFDTIDNQREIGQMLLSLLNTNPTLSQEERSRWKKLLTHFAPYFTIEDIAPLFEIKEINDPLLLIAQLIREDSFGALEFPLHLKEKIAQFDHPEMVATTIALLAKLNHADLIKLHPSLVDFLFSDDASIRQEASKLLALLGATPNPASIILKTLLEKLFRGQNEEIEEGIVTLTAQLYQGFEGIDHSQTYRLLTAKSRVAQRVGALLLQPRKAHHFSIKQWAILANNRLFEVRQWAWRAYESHPAQIKEALPKSLLIFDTLWEDTRAFAIGYFASFELSTSDIIAIADSIYEEVQRFAKEQILTKNFDREQLLSHLAQHPSATIQTLLCDLILQDIRPQEILELESYFSTILYGVNRHRIAKNRILSLLYEHIEHEPIAQLFGRLASIHASSMVWADKSLYIQAMQTIAHHHNHIDLPLEEVSIKELSYGV
jgi:hypothetical protein